jgi:hypothetical protein
VPSYPVSLIPHLHSLSPTLVHFFVFIANHHMYTSCSLECSPEPKPGAGLYTL